jgi:DHA2 family multidrug resistance protein
MAFLFVPINTLVYTGVPLEKNNSVSGIVNLSSNMGGDVGIAFVTTLIARRSQKHQADLSSHTTHYNGAFEAKLNGLVASIQHTGTSAADALHKATAALYGQLVQQATTLAYIDAIYVLAIATALMVPLLALTQKPKGGPAAAGH